MVSIFNIISLVVNSSTNNNNNDNNNNINDNQGNENGAQNSESNTNNAMMAVTQVMQVPPGAGRRKRSTTYPKTTDRNSTLIFHNDTLILSPFEAEPIVVPMSNENIDESFLDEVGIGILLSLNNWHYLNINASSKSLPKACVQRVLCEMNHNCALFGNGAKLVSKIISNVIARDLSEVDEEENMLLKAANRGSRQTKSCRHWYEKACSTKELTLHTNNVKGYVKSLTHDTNVENHLRGEDFQNNFLLIFK